MLHISVSVLKLICRAIYFIGKRVNESVAGMTGPNMFKHLFIDWHPQIVIASSRIIIPCNLLRGWISLRLPCPSTARSPRAFHKSL
jgi:hypothetical protein